MSSHSRLIRARRPLALETAQGARDHGREAHGHALLLPSDHWQAVPASAKALSAAVHSVWLLPRAETSLEHALADPVAVVQHVRKVAQLPVGVVPPPPASAGGAVVVHWLWQLLVSQLPTLVSAVMQAGVRPDSQPV